MDRISRKDFILGAGLAAGAWVSARNPVTAALADSEEPTFAERLGWPKGSRVLMIHADDAGMSKASNDAIIETIEAGTVTSASVMMTCSWVPGYMRWIEEHPDVCTGVHLVFTSEWDDYRWSPVLGQDTVPGLLDKWGRLPDSVAEVVANATADEVEAEMRAQIEFAQRIGMKVSHIDSHMGTLFATPEYFERFMKVSIDTQIPMLIAGGHLTEAAGDNPRSAALLQPLVPKIWNSGLPVLDDIDTRSYGWKSTNKITEFSQMVRDLKPGITWFNVHPTMPSAEARHITNDRKLLWGDYHTLVNPKLKQVIEEEDVILTSWAELMERRKAVGDRIVL